MTRAALIALLVAGCGGATGPAESAPSRPTRIADHVTEAEPAPTTIAVTQPGAEGPQADPPPVEPPAFEE